MAGKVIAITGANGGLGQALAQRFVADDETVILLGRTLSKVQAVAEAIGGRAEAFQCEVSSPQSVREAFAAIGEKHGRLDVLVNNAAVFKPFLIEEASDEQILDAVMTNLAGPMFCSRAAIPLMSQGGHIINVSSESVTIPLPHLSGYQSTKAGLERFSQALHIELEDKNICVTVVRAGQMVGPGATNQIDPEAGMRFFQAAVKKGLNPMERPMTQFESVTRIFRAIIDSPADLHASMVVLEGRRGA